MLTSSDTTSYYFQSQETVRGCRWLVRWGIILYDWLQTCIQFFSNAHLPMIQSVPDVENQVLICCRFTRIYATIWKIMLSLLPFYVDFNMSFRLQFADIVHNILLSCCIIHATLSVDELSAINVFGNSCIYMQTPNQIFQRRWDLIDISKGICLWSAQCVSIFRNNRRSKTRLDAIVSLRLKLIMWNLLIFQLSAVLCMSFDANAMVFT